MRVRCGRCEGTQRLQTGAPAEVERRPLENTGTQEARNAPYNGGKKLGASAGKISERNGAGPCVGGRAADVLLILVLWDVGIGSGVGSK